MLRCFVVVGTVEGVSYDLKKMMQGKTKAVKGLTSGIEFLLKKNKVDYIKGAGTITGANSLDIELADGDKQSITTKNVLIATGSDVRTCPLAV